MMKLTLLLALVAVANCFSFSQLPGFATAKDFRITYSYDDARGNSIEVEIDRDFLTPARPAPAPARAAPAPARAPTPAPAPLHYVFLDHGLINSFFPVHQPTPMAATAPIAAPAPKSAPAPAPAPISKAAPAPTRASTMSSALSGVFKSLAWLDNASGPAPDTSSSESDES